MAVQAATRGIGEAPHVHDRYSRRSAISTVGHFPSIRLLLYSCQESRLNADCKYAVYLFNDSATSCYGCHGNLCNTLETDMKSKRRAYPCNFLSMKHSTECLHGWFNHPNVGCIESQNPALAYDIATAWMKPDAKFNEYERSDAGQEGDLHNLNESSPTARRDTKRHLPGQMGTSENKSLIHNAALAGFDPNSKGQLTMCAVIASSKKKTDRDRAAAFQWTGNHHRRESRPKRLTKEMSVYIKKFDLGRYYCPYGTDTDRSHLMTGCDLYQEKRRLKLIISQNTLSGTLQRAFQSVNLISILLQTLSSRMARFVVSQSPGVPLAWIDYLSSYANPADLVAITLNSRPSSRSIATNTWV
ncbi:hypothetical protein IW261DRAFT_1422485 [Armillaria novae-zelandiae]|uniref:Uncharacterized protein n=1 Tax=Armillaria novae-zelandiae TaxID=153914 RepID=A0AA39P0A3_9AGAR|nr:hypothetical protein IW261DRAFT_1422485 [Armillaria novae-zelandiae]